MFYTLFDFHVLCTTPSCKFVELRLFQEKSDSSLVALFALHCRQSISTSLDNLSIEDGSTYMLKIMHMSMYLMSHSLITVLNVSVRRRQASTKILKHQCTMLRLDCQEVGQLPVQSGFDETLRQKLFPLLPCSSYDPDNEF
jgi:hypothetical protein